MLALLKGSSPDVEFRDGDQGIALIEPLINSNAAQTPSKLETYAVCLAEVGNFDEALKFQRQALAAVENEESIERYDDNQLKALRNRLELYKRQRVYRLSDPAEVPMKVLGRKR